MAYPTRALGLLSKKKYAPKADMRFIMKFVTSRSVSRMNTAWLRRNCINSNDTHSDGSNDLPARLETITHRAIITSMLEPQH